MTKEEYLTMYKEDKLAEICARLDSERDKLLAQITELNTYIRELNDKYECLNIWGDVEKVFQKLKHLPAEEFLELCARMKNLIESSYHTSTTADLSRYNSIITTLHN